MCGGAVCHSPCAKDGVQADSDRRPFPCHLPPLPPSCAPLPLHAYTPPHVPQIHQGTVTLSIAQRDLDPGSTMEYTQLLAVRKQFTQGVHATYDLYFTVRFVTVQAKVPEDTAQPSRSSRRPLGLLFSLP